MKKTDNRGVDYQISVFSLNQPGAPLAWVSLVFVVVSSLTSHRYALSYFTAVLLTWPVDWLPEPSSLKSLDITVNLKDPSMGEAVTAQTAMGGLSGDQWGQPRTLLAGFFIN